jgi:predicted permease
MQIITKVFPVLFMLILGLFLKRRNVISTEGMNGIETLITKVMLPVVIFNAIAATSFTGETAAVMLATLLLLCLIMLAGFFLRNMLKPHIKYLPYMVSSMEGGMLGYPLYTVLYGTAALSNIMTFDLANIIFAFSIYYFLITVQSAGNIDIKSTLKDLLHNPIVVALIAGLLMSLTGLGKYLTMDTQFGNLYSSLEAMITGPITALILLSVGYGLKINKEIIPSVLKVSAVRIVLNSAAVLILFLIFHSYFVTQEHLVALILYFSLPVQFVAPMYIKNMKDKELVSTQASFYSLITILMFIVINIIWF